MIAALEQEMYSLRGAINLAKHENDAAKVRTLKRQIWATWRRYVVAMNEGAN